MPGTPKKANGGDGSLTPKNGSLTPKDGSLTPKNGDENGESQVGQRQRQAAEKLALEAAAESLQRQAEEDERIRFEKDPRSEQRGFLEYWEPDNPVFWHKWGWTVALPNLICSTFNMMLCFAIWKQWGSIVGNLKASHKANPDFYQFGFDSDKQSQKDWTMAVSTLGGVAALSGAVHRTMHSFMPAAVGGRTLNVMNNVIGCGAMIITTLLLQNNDASYAGLFCMAVASGIGGGGFSSIMSGISEFFPEKLQGTATGLVGGIGNLGISLSQMLYWLLGDYGICFTDKRGFCVPTDLGGKWSYQITIIWVLLLVIGIVTSYFFTHNIPEHGVQIDTFARPMYRRNTWNIVRYLGMQAIVYLVAFCGAGIFWAFAPLVRDVPEVAIIRGFIIAAVSAGSITVLLFLATFPTQMRECVQDMFKILRSLDTFLLSLLYIMTFSSFLGYANTFPKLIKSMFPHVASVRDYSWMAPFLGSVARVAGGVVADKVYGAYSTMAVAAVMTTSTFVMGFVIRMAMASEDPAGQFPAFVLLHAILFIATGFGNGTVFRLIAAYLPRGVAGPTLGWTGAMAAYGGAIFPTFFNASINAGVNDLTYYMISGYYGLCIFITWRYCFWVSKLA